MKKLLALPILIFVFAAARYHETAIAPAGYKVVHKFQLPGNSFWDYLAADGSTGRIFVSHGVMVQVVDVNDGSVIGTIPNTQGVHGIALAPDLNKGFISDGRDSSVTVFDLKTLKVLGKIEGTGQNPDCILYDQYTHRVFTFNGRSSTSTVIDGKTDKIIGTIVLPGRPEFAVTDNAGHIFNNVESKSEIAEINPKTMKVERTWSIAPGDGPSGLAIDPVGHRLFSVCHNKLMVISDYDAGKVVTTEPIGTGVDGAAFDPVLKRAYSSNGGDGTITVVQEKTPDSFSVIENVPTQRGARTMTVDTKNHHLYLSTAQFMPRKAGQRRPSLKPGSFTIIDVAPVK